MNHKRIQHNYATHPNKKNLPAPRAGQHPQAHPSQSKGAITFPGPIEQRGVDDTASGPMTNEELLSRAKRSIDSCETPLRAAAEDIARAYEQGATQRELAEGVGKSPAWVNRLLKWRSSGYEGTAFGDKFVQGVNKNASPLEPASTEPTSASTTLTALGKNESAGTGDRERLVDTVKTLDSSVAQETVNAAAVIAPATKTLSAARASGDYHLPQELNRQDPERAFQRLSERWRSLPGLLLDSPKAAQLRFLREVVLPEVGGPQPLELLASDDRSAG